MKVSMNYLKIESERFGTLLNEGFMEPIQFKLFLKMVHGCLVNKEDLSFFNGSDYLVHIPYRYLVDSIVLTSQTKFETESTITEHFKSKMEALVTK